MNDGKGILYGIGAIIIVVLGFFALRGGGGLLAFLGKAALWGIGIAAAAIIAIVVLVIFLAMRSSTRKGASSSQSIATGGGSTSARKGYAASLSQGEKEVLANGSRELSQLRVMAMRVKDIRIRELSERVCERADKILSTLRDKPNVIPKARQFLSYYLPTLGKILSKYTQMEQGGVAEPVMTQRVLEYLGDIQTATEKQYSNLFEAEILDLTVEMEVMTMACKRDGLLTDQEMMLQSDGGNISLTL